MDIPENRPLLRIGELSRRLGVSDYALRTWESRYGLLQPVRSAGGFRLYSQADESRIRRMQAYLADGLSAAEAARTVLRDDGVASADLAGAAGPHLAASTVSELSAAFRKALDAFDEPAAQAVLNRLVSDLSLTTVLRDVVIPYRADLGERWQRGTASIARGASRSANTSSANTPSAWPSSRPGGTGAPSSRAAPSACSPACGLAWPASSCTPNLTSWPRCTSAPRARRYRWRRRQAWRDRGGRHRGAGARRGNAAARLHAGAAGGDHWIAKRDPIG